MKKSIEMFGELAEDKDSYKKVEYTQTTELNRHNAAKLTN